MSQPFRTHTLKPEGIMKLQSYISSLLIARTTQMSQLNPWIPCDFIGNQKQRVYQITAVSWQCGIDTVLSLGQATAGSPLASLNSVDRVIAPSGTIVPEATPIRTRKPLKAPLFACAPATLALLLVTLPPAAMLSEDA